MADISRHDRNDTRSGDLGHAVYRYLEFALNLIDFFLRMDVFVNRRNRAKSECANVMF